MFKKLHIRKEMYSYEREGKYLTGIVCEYKIELATDIFIFNTNDVGTLTAESFIYLSERFTNIVSRGIT